MKTILDNLKVEKAMINLEYNKSLKEAGFIAEVPNYLIITVKNIEEYLKNLIFEYAEEHKDKYKNVKRFRFRKVMSYHGSKEKMVGFGMSADLIDKRFFIGSEFINRTWVERDIKECKMKPPQYVLKSIIKAREDFDEIKIVTIEEVFDPLVVGIKENDPDRYLIDWWEKDIDPSELIKE